jgi:hypothetical protein
MLLGRIPQMTATEPQSIAAVLALGLIATLATAAPGQVQSPERRAGGDVSTPVEDDAPADEIGTSGELHHYAILGAVKRPGVYLCVDDDLTLAELVNAAGGTSPQAGAAAQVIRRGHTGPRLNCSPPSTARLTPGDVVAVESSAAADSGWVGVALVGLQPGEPVVVQVPAPAPTLEQLIAALNQTPALMDSVRLLRTSSRNVPPADGQPGQLAEGDIVVFDPPAIDRAALAEAESFPPPVLIPRRERRADVKIEIRPQQRAAINEATDADGETVLMAATAAAGSDAAVQAEQRPDEVWSLTSPPEPKLEQPASPPMAWPDPMANAASASKGRPPADDRDAAGQQVADDRVTDNEAVSLDRADDARADRSARNSRELVAASLVSAPPGAAGRSEPGGGPSATAEPERMSTPQGGVMISLAGIDRQRGALPTTARINEAGAANAAALPAKVPTPSDPSVPGNAPTSGARTLPLGITVLATILVCFAASLLWARLGDSTGLPGTTTGLGSEELPLHAPPERRGTLQRLINNALPIIEEPTLLPDRADFHGEAVGRRRLRLDAEQNLSGPHFAAPQKAPQPVAVPETAGTANTRPKRDASSVDTPAGDATASSNRDAAQGGLLDRVLVAMEREKRR